MSYYCINPNCGQRQNPENLNFCQTCGTSLLINNRYRLIAPLRELHEGYLSEIFEVQDWESDGVDSETIKILKVLKPTNNRTLIRLFRQEVRVLMSLKHQGIPKIEPDGYFTFPLKRIKLHCLIMDKVEGQNLEQWVEDNGSISEDLAINWLQQITEILALVHQKGYYHRDIKPSNIMLKPDGKLVLIDFGTVREISSTLLEKVGNRDVTQVVSKGYTAPEQIQGQAIPKSDLFALGRTFVYLLTGMSPIELEDSETGYLNSWRELCTGISESFADFIDRLIATSSQNRPKNPQDILKWINQIQLADGTKIKESYLEVTATVEQRIKENILLRLARSSKFKFALAALSFLGYIYFQLVAPQLAISFNNSASDNYEADELDNAQFNINLALMLNPNLSEAYYIQGLLFDARQDLSNARLQYEKAIAVVPDKVHNNLGRLDIIEGNYADAIARLQKGLQLVKEVELKSSLHKNMGWALLKLGDHKQAYTQLREAIKLNEQQSSAYCLLAQVQEAQGKQAEALSAWKSCLEYGSIDKPLPEVKQWTALAKQRLAPQAAQVFSQK